MESSKQSLPETRAILRRMEEVRCDLDEGAREIVESARDIVDWRHYVKTYPWICLGAACAVGYALIPRSGMPAATVSGSMAEPSDHSRLLTSSSSTPANGVRRAVLKLAGNLLWRSAVSYARRRASQYLEAQSDTTLPEV